MKQSYNVSSIRDFGFTVMEARALDDLGVKGSDLHRVFVFNEQRVPYCSALRHAPSFGVAIAAYLAAELAEESVLTDAAKVKAAAIIDEAEEVLANARTFAERSAIDVEHGPQLALTLDIRCAPVQRLTAGSLRLLADFDASDYRLSCKRSVSMSEEVMLDEHPIDAVAAKIADLTGATIDEAAALLEQVRGNYEDWKLQIEVLGEYSSAEARGILLARARLADDLWTLRLPGVA